MKVKVYDYFFDKEKCESPRNINWFSNKNL